MVKNVDRFTIWFNNHIDAHQAWDDLIHAKLVTDKTKVVYMKDIRGGRRGWGFEDHELGLMAKMVVGK